MSNARTKAERSRAKDARQIPAPDPGKHPSKRKRERPFIVECRRNPDHKPASLFGSADWRTWGRYHSKEVAQTAIDLAKSKYTFFEFRIGASL